MATKKTAKTSASGSGKPVAAKGDTLLQPQFAQPSATADPKTFKTKNASDTAAYSILDKEAKTLKPLPFPPSRGGTEPVLTLEEVLGGAGAATVKTIAQQKQIVFHALGDTGNTRSVLPQNAVTDKLISDFDETDPAQVPSFLFHLGDVVYSFGEAAYYYDQFYEPYREYPRPIIAIAGNHDGMVAPNSSTPSLQAFLNNFCASSPAPSSDAGAGWIERR